jgi:hypothetical protein
MVDGQYPLVNTTLNVDHTVDFTGGMYTTAYNLLSNSDTIVVLNNSLGSDFIFNVACSGGASMFGSAGPTFTAAAA